MRPVQHGTTTEFLSVVSPDYTRQAPFKPESIQNPGQRFATDGSFWDDGNCFVRSVIHDRY